MRSLHRAAISLHCHKRGSNKLAAAAAVWHGPERAADIRWFEEITSQILQYEVEMALAVDDSECTIQDVARMCYLLQRWRTHRDFMRAIEETFPASGEDPIASSLTKLNDSAVAKALRAFVISELTAFAGEAKSEEKAAMGCITWSWFIQRSLTDAVNDLVPRLSKTAATIG